ncbi:MAG: hypothetical protein R3A79_12510 [Nannocystaceae bacterium]
MSITAKLLVLAGLVALLLVVLVASPILWIAAALLPWFDLDAVGVRRAGEVG